MAPHNLIMICTVSALYKNVAMQPPDPLTKGVIGSGFSFDLSEIFMNMSQTYSIWLNTRLGVAGYATPLLHSYMHKNGCYDIAHE